MAAAVGDGSSRKDLSFLRLLTINVFKFGLTRAGIQRTGPSGTAFTQDSLDPFVDYTRGFTRIAPTWNFVDDLTWTKRTHTITTGANIRFVRNNRTNYANPSTTFSSSSLGKTRRSRRPTRCC